MRFLHISDLHFCPKEDGRDSRNLRDALITFLKNEMINVDEIFFTGDFRHARLQANEDQETVAKDAVEYIYQIASAVGIDNYAKHIHVVPGNHDRDRGISAQRAKKIREIYSSGSGTLTEKDTDMILSQFKFFRIVCKLLYGENDIWESAKFHTYFVAGNYTLLLLNTAIMHNRDSDRGNLLIANDEADRILTDIVSKYPKNRIIVLAHHSSGLFSIDERKAIEEIFQNKPVDLYLCGDSHEVWPRKINSFIEITMGSLKSEEKTEAAFMVGDTELQSFKVFHWTGIWEKYERFNQKIKELISPVEHHITPEMVETAQEHEKNSVILPWMRNSASLKALFPTLFITPNFDSRKLRSRIRIDDFASKLKNKNIVICGAAGAGKTTLLKYIFLYKNPHKDILYLRATALFDNNKNSYEANVIALLNAKWLPTCHYTVLIDGIDEAFVDKPNELEQFINSISKLDNIAIWFGWRDEDFQRQENELLCQIIDEVVCLQPWDFKMAERYIAVYSKMVKCEDMPERFEFFVKSQQGIADWTKSPFQLTLLAYLLENRGGDLGIENIFRNKEGSLYALYETFFQCWIHKEQMRRTSTINEKEIEYNLENAAMALYYGSSYVVNSNDSAVVDLLVFSTLGNNRHAVGFYHRSLCAFFYAHRVFSSAICGGIALVDAFKSPLRNDVTDFVRSAVANMAAEEQKKLYHNLTETYMQTNENGNVSIDCGVKEYISALCEDERFYLKNELLYLATRLPNHNTESSDLLKYANQIETNPYLKLDIAYGAVITGPEEIALEYAASLNPGSESDIVNRSWTLAYFGDVHANPYTYRDNQKSSWEKSRTARLRRFQSARNKDIRFRILDFPLMFCFYHSRDWEDVNEDDYRIIEQADIECVEFSDAEKSFLKQQKEKLLLEYRKHLPKCKS